MDRKTGFKALTKLAMQQFAILNKLAQVEPLATGLAVPETLDHGQEANKILGALAPAVKATIDRLEVPAGMNEVKVRFHPGKGSQHAYDAILATVSNLQKQNQLPGKQYRITAA